MQCYGVVALIVKYATFHCVCSVMIATVYVCELMLYKSQKFYILQFEVVHKNKFKCCHKVTRSNYEWNVSHMNIAYRL